jgi:hypothetical protein
MDMSDELAYTSATERAAHLPARSFAGFRPSTPSSRASRRAIRASTPSSISASRMPVTVSPVRGLHELKAREAVPHIIAGAATEAQRWFWRGTNHGWPSPWQAG